MTGTHLHRPAFADDDGRPDPLLRAALTGDLRTAHALLLRARLLVPVVADGRDMASVSITGADGRVALPAFTGLDALHAWRSDARPVAVRASDAALAALTESADALVLDVAGPRPVVVAGPALRALAESRPWLRPVDDPEVLAAIRSSVAALGVRVRVDDGGAESDLIVTIEAGSVDEARLCAAALADVAVLRSRLERGVAIAIPTRDTP